MNKKFLIFGILGLFAIALVSAGLVGYLSNTIQADVGVESPMLQEVWDGEWRTGTLDLDNMFGGESQTFYVRTTNQANAEIIGDTYNQVWNSDGVTCADFDSVLATTVTGDVSDGPYDLIGLGLCFQGEGDQGRENPVGCYLH